MSILEILLLLCVIGISIFSYLQYRREQNIVTFVEDFIEEFNTLQNEFIEYKLTVLEDNKKVVQNIEAFIKKSERFSYNDDVNRLLTYLRSFVQNLSKYVNEQEVLLQEIAKEQDEEIKYASPTILEMINAKRATNPTNRK